MQERELIKAIAAKVGNRHPLVKKGIGDDCAIFTSPAGSDLLVTADMLVEDVHFNTRWHDPFLLGRKALTVNMSDIAGMGGIPQFTLLSFGVSPACANQWMKRFFDGFTSLLDEYRCELIGGDTVTAAQLTMSITVIGSVEGDGAICRSTACAGDSIYVSGNLGSAAAGLHLCQHFEYTVDTIGSNRWPDLIRCHLDPQPRVELGRFLRKSGIVTAMQDISDGLATDLSHICTASGVHGLILEENLPADQQLIEMCENHQLPLVDFQIRGGDDYELLFTVRQGKESLLEELVRNASNLPQLTRIGEIHPGSGVSMLTKNGKKVSIEYQGYEHSTSNEISPGTRQQK